MLLLSKKKKTHNLIRSLYNYIYYTKNTHSHAQALMQAATTETHCNTHTIFRTHTRHNPRPLKNSCAVSVEAASYTMYCIFNTFMKVSTAGKRILQKIPSCFLTRVFVYFHVHPLSRGTPNPGCHAKAWTKRKMFRKSLGGRPEDSLTGDL